VSDLACWVDGTLTPDQLSHIDGHVDTCPGCFALLVGLERTRTIDGALEPPPLAMARRIPAILAKRYTILDVIGHGAMGVVYAAFDRKLDRKIAIKSLHPRHRSDDRLAQRLAREAQALAKLSHPNVIAVYDIVADEGAVFLAMEFVAGQTLQHWLAAKSRTAREVLDVFAKAGRGLAEAHAAGIVHRDFKPSNVLIGDNGRVCVIDFGLAARDAHEKPEDEDADADVPALGDITRTGNVLGTPAYMAPEQSRGESLDDRSDQYSFCVALHEALFGARPLAAADHTTIVTSKLARPGTLARGVRRALARGLQADRGARYASMDALLEALAARRLLGWKSLAAAIAVAGIGGGLVAHYSAAQTEGPVCGGGEAELAGIWDVQRKAEIARAFLATAKPYAGDAWRQASATLDAYTSAWVATRTDACEATKVRGDQSERLMDQREACLHHHRADLAALSDVFVHADDVVVRNAVAASQQLPNVDQCSDIHYVSTYVTPRPEIAAVRMRLASVKALDFAGKISDALSLAEQIEADPRATSDPAIRAEALLWRGLLQVTTGEPTAPQTLIKAVLAADEVGADRARLEGLVALSELFSRANQPDKARAYEEEAAAIAQRLGGEGEAPVLQALVKAQYAEGKGEDARVSAERLVAVERKTTGEASWRTASAMALLGSVYAALGQDDRALQIEERALTIEVNLLGNEHPSLAVIENTIGGVLYSQAKYVAAEPHLRRAVHLLETATGGNDPECADALNNLGSDLSEQRRYQEAVAVHERALAIMSHSLAPDHPGLVYSFAGLGRAYLGLNEPDRAVAFLERAVKGRAGSELVAMAEAKFLLAKALVASRGDATRALRLALDTRSSLETSTLQGEDVRLLAEVKDWLASRTSEGGAKPK
jgi:tRNA A-37 threonylcarbamoyl transferase component Bud32/tetratricopeptide (TPR) repeat protein